LTNTPEHRTTPWIDPLIELPEYGVDVMCIIEFCTLDAGSRQNVMLFRKQSEDADWFTSDDGSELDPSWNVVSWMPMTKPSVEVLDDLPNGVSAYIAALEENSRILATRNRRTRLLNNTYKEQLDSLGSILEGDDDEITSLKRVVSHLAEGMKDAQEECAYAYTRRDKALAKSSAIFRQLCEREAELKALREKYDVPEGMKP